MSKRKVTSATARLKQDYVRLKKDPVPHISAEPLPENILEWHYCVTGPESTPYETGYYHGKLVFPKEFPFKPPSIYMITPSGRFKTNSRLCLSISDFHPDTWNPAWSVSTILTGLLSFMIEKSPTMGSIETTDYDKRLFAFNSLEFNLRDKQFCDLFPDIVTLMQTDLKKRSDLKKYMEGENPNQLAQESSNFQSILTNIVVLIGFAAFAFTVKFVMKTSYLESD